MLKKILMIAVMVFLWASPVKAADSSLLMSIPPILAATQNPAIPFAKVYLDGLENFSCESNWMSRDGALGLAPYSGDGSCEAVFPGGNGSYSIVLTIQTEFDGRPPYRVSINGQVIKSGVYPLSSSLGCDCPQDSWRTECPNKNVNVNLGTFALHTGDKIEFWGHDDYPCPPTDPDRPHGAYAEWHGMSFTPVE